MNAKFIFPTLFSVAALTLLSCSKDDKEEIPAPDPEGTITLNMMTWSYGETHLGSPDAYVYISDEGNFEGIPYCFIADAGEVRGLGAFNGPLLSGLLRTAPVIQGHGYFIYDDEKLLKFPSDAVAQEIGTPYYKAYVDSWLPDRKGAVVKYIPVMPADNGLPVYGSTAATFTTTDESESVSLPVENFEYDLLDNGNIFNISKSGKRLDINLLDKSKTGNWELYLRIGTSYTMVHIVVL